MRRFQSLTHARTRGKSTYKLVSASTPHTMSQPIGKWHRSLTSALACADRLAYSPSLGLRQGWIAPLRQGPRRCWHQIARLRWNRQSYPKCWHEHRVRCKRMRSSKAARTSHGSKRERESCIRVAQIAAMVRLASVRHCHASTD